MQILRWKLLSSEFNELPPLHSLALHSEARILAEFHCILRIPHPSIYSTHHIMQLKSLTMLIGTPRTRRRSAGQRSLGNSARTAPSANERQGGGGPTHLLTDRLVPAGKELLHEVADRPRMQVGHSSGWADEDLLDQGELRGRRHGKRAATMIGICHGLEGASGAESPTVGDKCIGMMIKSPGDGVRGEAEESCSTTCVEQSDTLGDDTGKDPASEAVTMTELAKEVPTDVQQTFQKIVPAQPREPPASAAAVHLPGALNGSERPDEVKVPLAKKSNVVSFVNLLFL
jgi:hypothetical protein